jgi:uncharacterized protein with FMN-binding domain
LSFGKKHQSLVGKLLLSTALVAASLAYGWWQRHHTAGSTLKTAPMFVPPAANRPTRDRSTMTARAEATAPTTAPAVPTSQQNLLPAPPTAPLSALASLPMYQPPPIQTPLPLVTGTPALGAAPPIPPGAHLRDGDYLSDMQQYEWGDLTVKILVRGGQITGVQVVQYPDHRSESLELSKMACPILDSEVIKTQQVNVDVVSSATDTSFAFQYAIASALKKAAR